MKISQSVLAITILVIIFGTIGIANATGAWITEGGRNGQRQGQGHGQGQGQNQGQAPSRSFVRGQTTFKDIIALGISKQTIENSVQIKIPDESKNIRAFCEENNLQFHDIREIIDRLPADLK